MSSAKLSSLASMTSSLSSCSAPAGDVMMVGCAAFLMLFFDVVMTTLLSLKEMLSITQCPTDVINARAQQRHHDHAHVHDSAMQCSAGHS